MNKEDIKAWLDFNLQDTLINISTIPFLIGFFIGDIYSQILLFSITFMLSITGLIVYFKNKDKKISKKTEFLNKWGSVLIVISMWILISIRLGWTITTESEMFTEYKVSTNSDQIPDDSNKIDEDIVFSFNEVNDRSNSLVTYVNGYTYYRWIEKKDEILYTSTNLDKLSKNRYLSSIDYNFDNFPEPGKYGSNQDNCYTSAIAPYEYKILVNKDEYVLYVCGTDIHDGFQDGTPEYELNKFVEFVGEIDTNNWEILRGRILEVSFSSYSCDIKRELPKNLSPYSFQEINYLYERDWRDSGLFDLEMLSKKKPVMDRVCYDFSIMGEKTYSTITEIKALFPHKVEGISGPIMHYRDYYDSRNVTNQYVESNMFVSYPESYIPDLNAYATNGKPHIVFCLKDNYDFENEKCVLNDDTSYYPWGAYPEPNIFIDHIHEYESLEDLDLEENVIILGEDKLGVYILKYSPSTDEMKQIAEDMSITFKIIK